MERHYLPTQFLKNSFGLFVRFELHEVNNFRGSTAQDNLSRTRTVAVHHHLQHGATLPLPPPNLPTKLCRWPGRHHRSPCRSRRFPVSRQHSFPRTRRSSVPTPSAPLALAAGRSAQGVRCIACLPAMRARGAHAGVLPPAY